MKGLAGDMDNTATVRDRPKIPAPRTFRSGAVFADHDIPIDGAQQGSEMNRYTPKTEDRVSYNFIEEEPQNAPQHDIEELKMPPDYRDHHIYERAYSASSQTEVKRAACNDDDDDDNNDIYVLTSPKAIAAKEDLDMRNGDDDDDDDDINMTSEQKSELLEMIKKLSEEQKVLKTRLSEHDQRLSSLMKKEPSFHRRLTTKRTRLMMASQTNTDPEYRAKGQIPMVAGIREEDKIYAQIEQLYANFCRINFPFGFGKRASSKAEIGIYQELDEIYSKTPVSLAQQNVELRTKVENLEKCLAQRQDQTSPKTSPTETEADKKIIPIKSGAQEATYYNLKEDKTRIPTSPRNVPQRKEVEQIGFTFQWTIEEYSKKLELEKMGKIVNTVSDVFEIGRHGYRGRLEIYLNGNGTGVNKCLSFFLCIVKGDYDDHLLWPAVFSLKFVLINQQDDKRTESLIYGKEDKTFTYRRPSGNSECKSDSWGLVEFVSHQMISTKRYIKDDVIKMQIRISKKV